MPHSPLDDGPDLLAAIRVDPWQVRLGDELWFLSDPTAGGELPILLGAVRERISEELGFPVPAPRLRVDHDLRPNVYTICVDGLPVADGELLVGYELAIQPRGSGDPNADGELVGFPTTEPVDGRPAIWVAGTEATRARELGATMMDPTRLLAAHAEAMLRRHAHDLLRREDVYALVDAWRDAIPRTLEDVLPTRTPVHGLSMARLDVGLLHHVLRGLLADGIPITRLPAIIETLTCEATAAGQPLAPLDVVRTRLGRLIVAPHLSAEGPLLAIVLAEATETELVEAICDVSTGVLLDIGSTRQQQLRDQLVQAWTTARKDGYAPVLLCDDRLRSLLAGYARMVTPDLRVIAYREVPAGVRVGSVGEVALPERRG